MKRILLLISLSALLSCPAADTPGLVSSTTIRKENGKEIRVRTDRFQFHSAVLTAVCRTSPESGAPPAQEMGLEFGRIQNGGWSIWNFLEIRGTSSAIRRQIPPEVSMQEIDGTLVADLKWNLSPGTLSLRMIQYPKQPEWLFLKVACSLPEETEYQLIFHMLPGGANWNIAERERVLITKDGEYNLAKSSAEFVPLANGLVTGNRNWQENYGEFLVFEPEQYKMISAERTANFINVKMNGKPGIREFRFALGHFFDVSKTDSVARFLNEQSVTIGEQLARVHWNLKLDPETFRRERDETGRLLETLPQNTRYREELQRLDKRRRNVLEHGNAAEESLLLQELRELKRRICEDGMKRFRN